VSSTRRQYDDLLDLVDAVVYADVFGAAVALDDVHRFARVAIDRAALERELTTGDAARLVVRHRSGAYTLRGREALADGFESRAARAEILRRRAARVGAVLRHVPFVRGILLTGSVAAGVARRNADVDLLVIVGCNRIGTVFAVLGPASRLIGRHVFCPNFYVSEDAISLEAGDVYVGHELGQAQSVLGSAAGVRDANPWLGEMFPNLPPANDGPAYRRSVVQRAIEALLGGRVGRAVELRARGLAAARLRAHFGGMVPSYAERDLARGASLRFHASGLEHVVPERYAARRRALRDEMSAAEPTG
jgi:hypothetical protein